MLIPLLSSCVAIYCVLKPSGPPPVGALRVMHAMSRFSNLETFLLAMVVYISQQRYLITVELHSAFYALIFYVFALVGSLICTTQAVRRASGLPKESWWEM